MKNKLFILFLFVGIRLYSQCPTPITYSVTTIPASCSTCCDGSAEVTNLTGGCPGYNFSWSDGSQLYMATNLCASITYTVTVMDAGCCGPAAFVCTPGYALGTTIKEPDFKNSITLYPNPSNGLMQLDYVLEKEQKGMFIIYDLLGKKQEAYELQQNMNSFFINEPLLNNGIYFYQVFINNKLFATDKLVIVK